MVVQFFFTAALLHGALWVVGGAKRGFTATVRALAYAQGPYLIALVPLCGASIAGLWTLVLSVIALAALHRISVGRAIGAYAVTIAAACCLCCLPVVGVASVASMAAVTAATSEHPPKLELPPMDGLPDDPEAPPTQK